MRKIQELFGLSDRGLSDLKKGTVACVLTNLSLMLSAGITIRIFIQLFKPLSGGSISWNLMWMLFGAGIVAAVITFFCSKNDYRHTYVSSYTAAEDSRIQIAETVRRLPMRVFDSKDLTQLTANMMNDCETIEHAMSHVVPPLVANIISCTIVCIVLAFFNWRMAVAIYCTLPVSFLVMLGSRRLQDRLNQRQIDARLKSSDLTQEYLDGIKIIKSCHLDGERFTVLHEALEDLKRMSVRMEMGSSVLSSGGQFLLQAGIGITIFVGARLLSGGEIELIPLLLSLVLASRIYGPILSVLTILPMMFHMLTAAGRLRELMKIPVMDGDSDIPIAHDTIELHNVTFKYQDAEVLSKITAVIPEGKITALVGPSGSGKSTITKLIARFWDVTEGKITMGGVDLKRLHPEYIMSKMAFVFQEVTLFSDTVMNNIRIGNLSATDEEVYQAAKAAYCDKFIERLPKGFQTVLGENGNTLSGGERQRISIARALLKNTPIILLDEATASLDSESEVYVQKAISYLIEGKTVLVIAHRLRTIAGSDQIIVLDKGKLVEQGDHQQLIARDGLYKRLYSVQQSSMNWSI